MHISPIPSHVFTEVGTRLSGTIASEEFGVFIDTTVKTLITTDTGTDFASFEQALAAAKQLTAGAQPGVALVQATDGWKLFEASVVAQQTTTGQDGTRGAGHFSQQRPTVSPLTATSFTADDGVWGSHDETIAIVDGDVILHAEFDGSRRSPRFVPGLPSAAKPAAAAIA